MKKPKKPSVSSLHKKLERVFNYYIRLRDTEDGYGVCISCGAVKALEDGDAGHFIPKTAQAIRYDERNVNFQCQKCNRFLRGNIHGYFPALEAKLGREVVDWLLAQKHVTKQWRVPELQELVEIYEAKLKGIK